MVLEITNRDTSTNETVIGLHTWWIFQFSSNDCWIWRDTISLRSGWEKSAAWFGTQNWNLTLFQPSSVHLDKIGTATLLITSFLHLKSEYMWFKLQRHPSDTARKSKYSMNTDVAKPITFFTTSFGISFNARFLMAACISRKQKRGFSSISFHRWNLQVKNRTEYISPLSVFALIASINLAPSCLVCNPALPGSTAKPRVARMTTDASVPFSSEPPSISAKLCSNSPSGVACGSPTDCTCQQHHIGSTH